MIVEIVWMCVVVGVNFCYDVLWVSIIEVMFCVVLLLVCIECICSEVKLLVLLFMLGLLLIVVLCLGLVLFYVLFVEGELV